MTWAASHDAAGREADCLLLPLGRMIEALIPALLPVLAYLGLVVWLFWRRSVLTRNKQTLALLVAFSAGVLLAGLPRLGSHQLLFLSPVFWILCGYFLYNGAAPRWEIFTHGGRKPTGIAEEL